jgi:2',3'-cyclic-nucleotide 2'-phosphodiesterase (5'-nucleotidase family)
MSRRYRIFSTKMFLSTLGIVSIIFCLFGCNDESNVEIKIDYQVVAINSLRGQIFPSTPDRNNLELKKGGAALIGGMLKSLKEKYGSDNLTMIANSSFLYGTPEAYFTRGRAIIEIMNQFNVNAFVLGHRDFYFGYRILLEGLYNLKNDDMEYLAANLQKGQNINTIDSQNSPIKPYFIKQKNVKTKHAVIGVVTDQWKTKITPRQRGEWKPKTNSKLSIDSYINELKDEKSIGDIFLAGDISITEEIAKNQNKLDALLQPFAHPELKAIFATKEGNYNGKYELFTNVEGRKIPVYPIEKKGFSMGHLIKYADGKMEYKEYPINSNGNIPYDRNIIELVHHIGRDTELIAEKIIGVTESEIEHCTEENMNKCKYQTEMGTLLTDIILDAYKDQNVSAVFLNTGSISRGLPNGEQKTTLKTINQAIPYEIYLVKLTVTGKDIKEFLEESVADTELAEAKRFAQVAGIQFWYDSSINTKHERIKEHDILIQDEPIDLEKEYQIITNEFIAAGGENYKAFTGKKSEDLNDSLFELVTSNLLVNDNKNELPIIKVKDANWKDRIIDISKRKSPPPPSASQISEENDESEAN